MLNPLKCNSLIEWTKWLGKRFVHFDERVQTGESQTCIAVQSKASIWAYKT